MKDECDAIARELVGQAIARCAADATSEATVSVVPVSYTHLHSITRRTPCGCISPQNQTDRKGDAARPCGRFYYLWQYRIILSADTASEVRQMLSQKRR